MADIILDESVKNDEKAVRKIISSSILDKNNLYNTVVDLFSEGTRTNDEQNNYLKIYETAVSIFRESSFKLRQTMDTQTLEERLGVLETALKEKIPRSIQLESEENKSEIKKEKTARDALKEQITESASFSNRYALYFAGQVGLALLDSEKAKEIDGKRFFLGTQYEAVQDRDGLASLIAKTTVQDLQRVARIKKEKNQELVDGDLKIVLQSIFTTWIDQFNWNTFKDVADKYKAEETTVKYGNYSIKAGDFKKKYDTITIDDKFMNVRKTDVIGSEEYVEEMWQSMLRLAGYDFQRKDNPLSPPNNIFTFGAPGGGKTMTAHALVRQFADLCKEQKIPLWAFTHSVTDYGSKYQNETPLQLATLRDKVKNFPGLVLMYAADVDTFMSSSRKGDVSGEENKVNGIYFSFFDGSIIPRNGRFMSIMDANFVDNIDPATKSRLFDKILELKRFSKPTDFAEYAKRYLSKGSAGVGVEDDEWQEIGEYLLNSPLSNREMSNIFNNLRGNFKVPVELISKQYQEKADFRNNYLKSITKKVILDKCDEFVNTRLEIERNSYKAKKENDEEKYRNALRTARSGIGLDKGEL